MSDHQYSDWDNAEYMTRHSDALEAEVRGLRKALTTAKHDAETAWHHVSNAAVQVDEVEGQRDALLSALTDYMSRWDIMADRRRTLRRLIAEHSPASEQRNNDG